MNKCKYVYKKLKNVSELLKNDRIAENISERIQTM